MSLAILLARAGVGVAAPQVTVEVQLSGGLPGFSIVGLPEAEVKESRDRVRAAILNSGYEFPVRKITVNLAPADLPKEGGRFDLAIALGILVAHGQLPNQGLENYEFYGELALSGDLRAVRGLLPAVVKGSRAGRTIVVPTFSSAEAGLVESDSVLHAPSLLAVCAHLRGVEKLAACPRIETTLIPVLAPDMRDVRGQHLARRALEVAATGAHLVITHSLAAPRTVYPRPHYDDVVTEVAAFLSEKVELALSLGVPAEKIIIDPGHDLNRNTLHTLEITRRFNEIAALGFPTLAAVSNKDFIGETLNQTKSERLEGSIASGVICILGGARILRMHNVAASSSAIRMTEAVVGLSSGPHRSGSFAPPPLKARKGLSTSLNAALADVQSAQAAAATR